MLVDNAKNYKMATVRQMILRPILRDGLLTAEGDVWKRSRKAMAPVFTPRHIFGFAGPMLKRTRGIRRALRGRRRPSTSPHDMTKLTYDILAETLFSGEIAGEPGSFAQQIDRLFETMGRVDPLDLLARAGLAAAPHPHPRPQDHGLFPQDRRRHDGHARASG